MRRSTFSLFLALPLLAAGCAEEEAPPIELARPVVVEAASLATLAERIEATGELRAKDQATIASEVPGRITELAVEEGDSVEAGQLLIAIDPEKRELEVADARARLAETRASLDELTRNLARVEKLHDQAIASEQALDKARTELASARSRVEAARAGLGVAERALQDANVRAPFAGVVAQREVSRGEYVQVGQALLDVVALNPIEVEFAIAERDSARVRDGLSVAVSVAPYPDEIFRGTVSVISPTIDRRTRTLRVKALIDNSDGRLRPGLFATTDLGISEREGVLVVPEAAILLRAEGEIVFVATEEDRAKRVSVETGTRRERRVEVTKGLKPGELVIVRGHAALADGALISRRLRDGSPDRSEVGRLDEVAPVASRSAAPKGSLQ